MTLEDINAAVDAGQTVHWANTGYVVHKDRLGQYLIIYLPNGSCIGPTSPGMVSNAVPRFRRSAGGTVASSKIQSRLSDL